MRGQRGQIVMRMNCQSLICEFIAIDLQSESNFVAKAPPPRVRADNVAEQFDVVQHIVRLPISADIRGLRRSWWLAPHPSWSALATSAQAVAALHICTSAHLQLCTFTHLQLYPSTHLHICSSAQLHKLLQLCTSARLHFAVCSLHI